MWCAGSGTNCASKMCREIYVTPVARNGCLCAGDGTHQLSLKQVSVNMEADMQNLTSTATQLRMCIERMNLRPDRFQAEGSAADPPKTHLGGVQQAGIGRVVGEPHARVNDEIGVAHSQEILAHH